MQIREEVLLTEEECSIAIAKWRSLLCLEDWDVYLTYLPSDKYDSDLGLKTPEGYLTRGSAKIDFYGKTVCLTICFPTEEHRKESVIFPWDMEKTIVHELVHVQFAHAARNYDYDYDSKSIVPLEQAVDAIASALIAAKRGYYVKLT